MANWAKLQEQLTGLPVVKRARSSIHFDKGNGEIVANLSGKPCHYEENGVWKPIDTGLLLAGDGWYGSPHSDVRIHPNGLVRVTGSDYEQYTELPSAKNGVLNNDRIIRTFPGGEQHLIMTENGFRQEIRVEKPTFPLEKFIARQTGNLPSKYAASPLTAVDADGNSYVFTGNVKKFGKWLDAAAYPVTIDPDFVVQPDGTTGMDVSISSSAPNTNNGTSGEFNIQYGGGWFGRGLIQFDLSTLAGKTIVSAVQYYTAYANATSTATTYMHRILSGNPWKELGATYNTIDGTKPWAGSAGCNTSGTDFSATAMGTNSSQYTANTEYSMNLDVTEFTAMVAANYGCVVFVTASWTQKKWHSSDAGVASYRPRLVVTYTTASTGVPKHFLHYARMRG